MRVVLVEDDPTTARSIATMLRSEGYVCDTANFGEDGLEIGELYNYDIIILDLKLPDSSSYEVLRRLRATQVQTPVLIVSGLSWLDDKLKDLGVAADDIFSKPFDKRELIERIQSVIERAEEHSDPIVITGKLTVNLDTGVVEVSGRPLTLTGNEYRIMALLALHKNTTLTKKMFLDHVYVGKRRPAPKIIDVFMSRLRKKLAAASGGETYIETVWGRGYVLREPAPLSLRLRQKRG